MTTAELAKLIRDVPDFPKKGIVFKDITPLLGDGAAFQATLDHLTERAAARRPDVIVAIESRGFIFGAGVAAGLGVGFVPVRKPGKLPWRARRIEYALEYGTDALEMHEDAVAPGARVLVVDDVLATGGTASATARLAAAGGADVVGCLFVIELGFLGGRGKLAPLAVDALIPIG
jgi:adenine phosphoribosyltransferase